MERGFISMKHIESYINESIKDPENLPLYIIDILNKLRIADSTGNSISYFDRIDDLCVIVKNSIVENLMTYEQWGVLKEKYWTYADAVFEKEFKNENG